MAPALAIDLSRLFLAASRPTPRGIDRVEFLYAQHFLGSWPGPCFATLPTPWGVRIFDRDRALRGIHAAAALWGESEHDSDKYAFRELQTWLSGSNRIRRIDIRSRHQFAQASVKLVRDVGLSWGTAIRQALPNGSLYVNVGHIGLSHSVMLNWLEHRPDVKAIFMLHDFIPMEHPQYVSPAEQRFFQRVVSNIRFATRLIVTTRVIADCLSRLLPEKSRDPLVSHLPVSPAFATRGIGQTGSIPGDYFVVCGQLEPRKNHRLLLDVWRLLQQRSGSVPKLVIVGGPGESRREISAALDLWDRDRRHALEVTGLPTPQLAELMRGATAVLMPSFTEGFGLPIIEALALGTPVIASDILAHREVGGPHVEYLDPKDANSWLMAIQSICEPTTAAEARSKLSTYRPRMPSEYFEDVEHFLRSI